MTWRALLSVALVVVAAAITAGAVLARTAAVPEVPSAPGVAGTAREGSTLTGTVGLSRTVGTVTVAHWQRCDSHGAGCADIGAPARMTLVPGIGITAEPYTIVAEDVDHTLRLAVVYSNADGSSAATSNVTAVVSSSKPPVSTAKPVISGKLKLGTKLTSSTGGWTGGVSSYAYQWQRCDSAGQKCIAVAEATSAAYTAASADAGTTLRVVVTGKNLSGSTIATSSATARVMPLPKNQAPTLAIISLKRSGTRIYARFKACDDSPEAITVTATDTKADLATATHRFSVAPIPCTIHAQDWIIPLRFRHGPYTATLHAVDKGGATSLTARRSLL